jgi:hypothetical protein
VDCSIFFTYCIWQSFADTCRADVVFKEGDEVLLSLSSLKPKHGVKKLMSKWLEPFMIVQAVNIVAYELDLPLPYHHLCPCPASFLSLIALEGVHVVL